MDSQTPAHTMHKAVDQILPLEFTVLTQKLELEIDFTSRSLTGTTILEIQPLVKDLRSISITAQQCVVDADNVRLNGERCKVKWHPLYDRIKIPDFVNWSAEKWQYQKERISPLLSDTENAYEPELKILIPEELVIREPNMEQLSSSSLSNRADISPALAASSKITMSSDVEYVPIQVSIPFSVRDFRDGLQFVGLEDGDLQYPHVYTRQSSMGSGISRCIFPCFDNPKVKPRWMISIKCGRTLGDALTRPAGNAVNGKGTHTSSGLHNGCPEKAMDIDTLGLDTESKLMEMTVVCSGDVVKDIIDPTNTTKKLVSFEVAGNMAWAGHIAFAVGPFEHVNLSDHRTDEDNRLGQKAVKVNAYCLPRRSAEVNNAAQPLAYAIDTFCMNYGAFPFTDYTVCFVGDQIQDTVDSASLTLCSERLLHPDEVIDELLPVARKLIHALARQYFGVSILPDKLGDTWLVVGISHFIMDQFMMKLCGINEYRYDLQTRAKHLMNLDVRRVSLFDMGEMLDIGSFQTDLMCLKAPLVLHMLDERMAKKTGSSGLSRVISKLFTTANTGSSRDDTRTLSTEAFQKICEKFGHLKLHDFFSQWVHHSGYPKFIITQKFDKKNFRIKMNIKQVQNGAPDTPRKLNKKEFAREVKEHENSVYKSELPPMFTGPMTIRIHEADGTPYEHIIEIGSRDTTIEIPYNTKYKRFRRSNRQKERENALARGENTNIDGPQDILLYCLGDVLQSEEDIREWRLTGWDQETLNKMEFESFEWISIDADHEWTISSIDHSMEPYMFSSQLQQDRDVVAHMNALRYMARHPPSEIISSILIRTVMDKRYFHGVRTMAAEALASHATVATNWVGKFHLEKAFKRLFCYPETRWTPLPNDFHDWQAYMLQTALATAMAKIRDADGNCPLDCQKFLYDQIRLNDNSDNVFSDSFYIAKLLTALTDSMIKIKPAEDDSVAFGAEIDEEELQDLQRLHVSAIEEIKRYQKIDQTMGSWKNAYTRAVLDSTKRLMQSGFIEPDHREFLAYIQDETYDLVQVEAMSAFVDLGMLFKSDDLIRFFVNHMATALSPYVRDQLSRVFWRGLASVAFGEHLDKQLEPSGDGLVVFQGQEQADARAAQISRSTTLSNALAALKTELKDRKVLKDALWEAVNSPYITLGEQMTLLDYCSVLYDSDETFLIILKYPRYYKVDHKGKVKRPLSFIGHEPHEISPSRSDSGSPSTLRSLESPVTLASDSLPNSPSKSLSKPSKTPSDTPKGKVVFTKTSKIRTKLSPMATVSRAPIMLSLKPSQTHATAQAPPHFLPPPTIPPKKTKAGKAGDMKAPAKPKVSASKPPTTSRPGVAATPKRGPSASSTTISISHSKGAVPPPVSNARGAAAPASTDEHPSKIILLSFKKPHVLSQFPATGSPNGKAQTTPKKAKDASPPEFAVPRPRAPTIKLNMSRPSANGASNSPAPGASTTPAIGIHSSPASSAVRTPLPSGSVKKRKASPAPGSSTKKRKTSSKAKGSGATQTPVSEGTDLPPPAPVPGGDSAERKPLPNGRKPLPDAAPKKSKKRKQDAADAAPPSLIVKLPYKGSLGCTFDPSRVMGNAPDERDGHGTGLQ